MLGKNGCAVVPRRGSLWKRALTHFVRIIPRRAEDQLPELRVLLHERRHEGVKEAKNVVADQHLTVAIRSSADANRGNLQSGSYGFGNRIWNRLQHDGKCSGIFKCERIENQFLRRFFIARLSPQSSKAMHVLRSQPDVSHDEKTRRREPANRVRHGASAFQLHRSRAAFLEESRRVARRLLCRNLISQKRHVGHDQGATRGSRHRARVMNDFIQSHLDRGVQSENHIAERIAHQQQIDTGSVEQPRHRRVVSGQHDDPLAARFHLSKVWHANNLVGNAQCAALNSCSAARFGLKRGEIFDLRSNSFMTRRFTLSRERIEASSCRHSLAPRLFHSQPKYSAAAKRIIISPSIGTMFGILRAAPYGFFLVARRECFLEVRSAPGGDRASQLPYLKDNSTRVRYAFTLPCSTFKSCFTTSAIRRSRSVPDAVSTAFFAASSHDFVLVPITSTTL